jgi:hypothetical protein
MMSLEKSAVSFLNKELKLPATGLEEDWEIEMADGTRVADFISYILNEELSSQVKYALMALILASYEECLVSGDVPKNNQWLIISTVIREHLDLYADLLNYWAVQGDENKDSWFEITPMIRELAG